MLPLPNNTPDTKNLPLAGCPSDAPVREIAISAVRAADYGSKKGIVYNTGVTDPVNGTVYNEVADPDGIMYVYDALLDSIAQPDWPMEPLVMRANAGECIKVTLTNRLSKKTITPTSLTNNWTADTKGISAFNPEASNTVGIHAELVSYKVGTEDGSNVGFNQFQTLADSGDQTTVNWYAGTYLEDGTSVPVEFGGVNLSGPDPLAQAKYGLFGALIVEPEGTLWRVDGNVFW